MQIFNEYLSIDTKWNVQSDDWLLVVYRTLTQHVDANYGFRKFLELYCLKFLSVYSLLVCTISQNTAYQLQQTNNDGQHTNKTTKRKATSSLFLTKLLNVKSYTLSGDVGAFRMYNLCFIPFQGDSSIAVLLCLRVCVFICGVCVFLICSLSLLSPFDASGRLCFVTAAFPGYL